MAKIGLGRRVRARQMRTRLDPNMETLTFIAGLSALVYVLLLPLAAAAVALALGVALEPLWRQVWASTRPR